MKKVDYRKELRHLYAPSAKEVVTVDVPPLLFLMVNGRGDPNTSPDFPAAVEALYGLSFTLKFSLKKAGVVDYVVAPLEGLWWMDPPGTFDLQRRDLWLWTLMQMQPQEVTADHLRQALDDLRRRRKTGPALAEVRLELFHEGLAAQILHIGPYAQEGPAIARIFSHIAAGGHRLRGKHHEIYLSDPRRTAAERLKTILRHPFA